MTNDDYHERELSPTSNSPPMKNSYSPMPFGEIDQEDMLRDPINNDRGQTTERARNEDMEDHLDNRYEKHELSENSPQSRSIMHSRSRSPSPIHSRLPSRSRRCRSPSPLHARSPSPRHSMSPSPRHSMSPSPRHSRSPSPRRSRLSSPRHSISPSPRRSRLSSPRHSISPSPRRSRLPSPRHSISPSPRRSRPSSPSDMPSSRHADSNRSDSSLLKRSHSPSFSPRHYPDKETNILFLRQLTPNATEEHVREICSLWGKVLSVNLARFSASNKPKGFATVEFETTADAKNALLHMDKMSMDHLELLCFYTLEINPELARPIGKKSSAWRPKRPNRAKGHPSSNLSMHGRSPSPRLSHPSPRHSQSHYSQRSRRSPIPRRGNYSQRGVGSPPPFSSRSTNANYGNGESSHLDRSPSPSSHGRLYGSSRRPRSPRRRHSPADSYKNSSISPQPPSHRRSPVPSPRRRYSPIGDRYSPAPNRRYSPSPERRHSPTSDRRYPSPSGHRKSSSSYYRPSPNRVSPISSSHRPSSPSPAYRRSSYPSESPLSPSPVRRRHTISSRKRNSRSPPPMRKHSPDRNYRWRHSPPPRRVSPSPPMRRRRSPSLSEDSRSPPRANKRFRKSPICSRGRSPHIRK